MSTPKKTRHMVIYTPYGDEYIVNLENGNISRPNWAESGGWKFIAFKHVKRNVFIRLEQIKADPNILNAIAWTYKNRHPQWTVLDLDHGTRRIWRNTIHHGVSGVFLERSQS